MPSAVTVSGHVVNFLQPFNTKICTKSVVYSAPTQQKVSKHAFFYFNTYTKKGTTCISPGPRGPVLFFYTCFCTSNIFFQSRSRRMEFLNIIVSLRFWLLAFTVVEKRYRSEDWNAKFSSVMAKRSLKNTKILQILFSQEDSSQIVISLFEDVFKSAELFETTTFKYYLNISRRIGQFSWFIQ